MNNSLHPDAMTFNSTGVENEHVCILKGKISPDTY